MQVYKQYQSQTEDSIYRKNAQRCRFRRPNSNIICIIHIILVFVPYIIIYIQFILVVMAPNNGSEFVQTLVQIPKICQDVRTGIKTVNIGTSCLGTSLAEKIVALDSFHGFICYHMHTQKVLYCFLNIFLYLSPALCVFLINLIP